MLPESFGFLVSRKKTLEVRKWIQRAQRWGGRPVVCDVQQAIENETAKIPEESNLFESLSKRLLMAIHIRINFITLSFLPLLPESFGFLVSRKKTLEVRKWIQRSQRWGGRPVVCDVQQAIENETAKLPEESNLFESLNHIVHNPTIMLHIAIQSVTWIVDFLVYSALSLTATAVIDGNSDSSYLFSGLVELPCYFIMPISLDQFGRKPTVIISHALTSIALFAVCFLNAVSFPTVYLFVWMLAKFGMASCFMCCFVYGAEIFPVQYRNICLGFCSTICNIGAMMAPHCNVLDHIVPGLMFGTFATLCSLCAFLTLFLPETKHFH
ncbi:hypothetical protein DICVIV_04860 [Dictyocaulus viviparus]|uniref:Major facilitator superfamily (MFS) profile domain-containing protein n=1 Tax=Dictyocaulus viviparus TaxID=29172 RepID=A0A0D8XYU6_DICVI|nr:hypothetical protein DICVIV_04860 [Dictyocaulus viviparus]